MNDEPLTFIDEAKIRRQMRLRGWTDAQIREASAGDGIATESHLGSAKRFVHPTTHRSVVILNATGQVVHVGGDGFLYDS